MTPDSLLISLGMVLVKRTPFIKMLYMIYQYISVYRKQNSVLTATPQPDSVAVPVPTMANGCIQPPHQLTTPPAANNLVLFF